MSSRAMSIIAVLAIIACIDSMGVADTVIFQEGEINLLTSSTYIGTEDNTIIKLTSGSAHVDYNYGVYHHFSVGSNGTTILRKALMRFDLSSLDGKYASIDSVKLKLHVLTDPGPNVDVSFANTLELYRLTDVNGDWVEGSQVTGGIENGASCWNYRQYNTKPWDSGVGGTSAADYNGPAIASLGFGPTNPTGWLELDFNDVSFIGNWVVGNNPGMVLRVTNEATNSLISFEHSEHASALLHPQLVINYTPVPEPGSLALLLSVFTAIYMIRRKH
ncbi:MAG: DNRLRE domain-containing protein [Pirellulales bacterium]|nr:DNRLRE domain-containing protein [Pirellulales bacterium]